MMRRALLLALAAALGGEAVAEEQLDSTAVRDLLRPASRLLEEYRIEYVSTALIKTPNGQSRRESTVRVVEQDGAMLFREFGTLTMEEHGPDGTFIEAGTVPYSDLRIFVDGEVRHFNYTRRELTITSRPESFTSFTFPRRWLDSFGTAPAAEVLGRPGELEATEGTGGLDARFRAEGGVEYRFSLSPDCPWPTQRTTSHRGYSEVVDWVALAPASVGGTRVPGPGKVRIRFGETCDVEIDVLRFDAGAGAADGFSFEQEVPLGWRVIDEIRGLNYVHSPVWAPIDRELDRLAGRYAGITAAAEPAGVPLEADALRIGLLVCAAGLGVLAAAMRSIHVAAVATGVLLGGACFFTCIRDLGVEHTEQGIAYVADPLDSQTIWRRPVKLTCGLDSADFAVRTLTGRNERVVLRKELYPSNAGTTLQAVATSLEELGLDVTSGSMREFVDDADSEGIVAVGKHFIFVGRRTGSRRLCFDNRRGLVELEESWLAKSAVPVCLRVSGESRS